MIKSDIEELKLFACCPEDRAAPGQYGKPVCPQPWSHEAQGLVRNLRPVRAPKFASVGLDVAEEIGAAVAYEDDGVSVFLGVLAIALHLHGKKLGDHLLQRVFEDVTERAMDRLDDEFAPTGPEEIVVEAKVHPQNDRSRRLMERWRFEMVGREEPHDIWRTTLPIAGA